jgi:NADPH-dependent 2,4-dienoyl-CoA reductase/sulfur reductase-like enzyme
VAGSAWRPPPWPVTDGADVVIVGVGITPNTQLAEAAGLEIGDGITTDASPRTSDPDTYAAGDVACAYHPLLATHIRVEHWANALAPHNHQDRHQAGYGVRPLRVHDLPWYLFR